MPALQVGGKVAGIPGDGREIVIGSVLDNPDRSRRPARLVQDVADLFGTRACVFGIARRDDDVRGPQARCGQRVLHDLLRSKADENAWRERHGLFRMAAKNYHCAPSRRNQAQQATMVGRGGRDRHPRWP